MWKSLSTRMFSGLMSLCMMSFSVRYSMASKISKTILPLTDRGTETWKQGRGGLILHIKRTATWSYQGMNLWNEYFSVRYWTRSPFRAWPKGCLWGWVPWLTSSLCPPWSHRAAWPHARGSNWPWCCLRLLAASSSPCKSPSDVQLLWWNHPYK